MLGEHIAQVFDPSPSTSFRKAAVRMLEPNYQPIVRLDDGRLVGLEVLARLNHPQHGRVPPDGFVPAIEAAGLAAALTDLVVAHALADLASGLLGTEPVWLSVNLPLDVLLDPSALERMERQRIPAGIQAARIVIELTESQEVHDIAGLADAIGRWREAGYALALDDLGPLVPNWRALLELPFNAVKLDKSIVQAAASPGDAADLVRQVVRTARCQGMHVIAEGVETPAHWNAAKTFGATLAQGWVVAPPMAPNALLDWVQRWTGAA